MHILTVAFLPVLIDELSEFSALWVHKLVDSSIHEELGLATLFTGIFLVEHYHVMASHLHAELFPPFALLWGCWAGLERSCFCLLVLSVGSCSCRYRSFGHGELLNRGWLITWRRVIHYPGLLMTASFEKYPSFLNQFVSLLNHDTKLFLQTVQIMFVVFLVFLCIPFLWVLHYDLPEHILQELRKWLLVKFCLWLLRVALYSIDDSLIIL